jgi:hypothetical protein
MNEGNVDHCKSHELVEYFMTENNKAHDDFWKAINGMRMWVIAGAGAVILQLGLVVINLLSNHKAG